MSAFGLIRERDVAALLRLAGEVGELPMARDVRRAHVLAGLLKLIGGRSAVCVEAADPDEGPFGRPGTVTHCEADSTYEEQGINQYLDTNTPADPALPEFIASRGRVITMVRPYVDNAMWYRSDHYNLVRRPHGIDETLYCRLVLPNHQDLCVGLQRCPGDPTFSDREKAIVHLFHENAPGIYYVPSKSAKPTTNPRIDALPRRLRPVLQHLLRGDAEKQVAIKLGLSHHTVHEYVKTLYRELGVNSRGELLASFVSSMEHIGHA